MSEKTLRRHAARAGLRVVKTRHGRLWLLMRGGSVVAVCSNAHELAANLSAAA